MKNLLLLLALLVPTSLAAQTAAFNGYCTLGSTPALTSGLPSSNLNQGLIPQCTVTVFNTGTTTISTIFADAVNTPLTNPFTASTKAQWLFFAATGQGYDVVMSGGFQPLVYTVPVTLTDLIVGGGGGGSGCVTSGPAGTLIASNGSGGCQPAQVQVNGVLLTTPSPINFIDTATVTVANPSAGQIAFTALKQVDLQTNSAENTSQAILNFTDTATIQFTNPSGGIESATCATATNSQIGCARPDNSTITISGGVLSSVTSSVDFKHDGTLLTGSFAANPQIYDYDETTPSASSGFIAATGHFDTATGKWNVQVPSTSTPALEMEIVPPEDGQHVTIYPTAVTDSGPVNYCLDPTDDLTSGQMIMLYEFSTFPPSTCSITWTFLNALSTQAPWVVPGNVGHVWAVSVNSLYSDKIGVTFNLGSQSLIPSGLPANPSWGQQQTSNLTSLNGTNLEAATAFAQLSRSGTSTPVTSIFTINTVAFVVYYTGTAPPADTAVQIASPLSWNPSSRILGLDPNFPNAMVGQQIATLPSAVGYINRLYFVKDALNAADCTVGGGTSPNQCVSNGSIWVPYAPGGTAGTVTSVATGFGLTGGTITTSGTVSCNTGSSSVFGCVKVDGTTITASGGVISAVGGGGGDTITSPGSTITVGGTSTNTTLDIALGHANTWTALQTFSSGISASSIKDTGSAATSGNLFCVQIDDTGLFSNTGTTCGGGGGGSTTVTVNGGSGLSTANLSDTAPAAGAGFQNITWQNSGADVSARLPLASASVFGLAKVDGTTITASGGVISAVGGGGGGSQTAWTSTIISPTTTNLSFPLGYYHFQIAYTDVKCASTTCDVAIGTVPTGFVLNSLTIVETTPFAGPAGLTAGTVSFGQGVSAPSGYMTPRLLYQSANTVNQEGGAVSMSFTTAATAFDAEFLNTTVSSPINYGNGSTTSLTAGLLDIYVTYTVQQ